MRSLRRSDPILTDRYGRPIEKPRRANFTSDAAYVSAFHAFKDRIAREANIGFDEGLHRSRRRVSRDTAGPGPYRFVRAQNLRAGDRVMFQGARPLTLRTVIVTGRGLVRATATNGSHIELDGEDRVRISPGSGVLSLRDKTKRRSSARLSPQKQKWISDKIRLLRREGYPQRQAIAIAFREAGVPARRRLR